MSNITKIKEHLKANGWSYRQAAKALGVTYQYLCDTANNKHVSKRLEARVLQLPNAYSQNSKISILKQKLVEANISQIEIARELKLTPLHINYVVNGKRQSRSLSLKILQLCNRRIEENKTRSKK